MDSSNPVGCMYCASIVSEYLGMLSRRHCHGAPSGVVLATSRLPAALYRRFATVKGYPRCPPELSAIARLCRAPAQWSTPFQAALGWLSCLDARRPMHRPNPRSLAPSFPASSSPQKGRARSCSSHSKPPSLALHPDLLGFLVFASSSFLLFLRYSLHTALFQPPFGSYTRCATPEPLHTHNKPTSIGYSHESRQSQQLLIIPRSVESVHPAFNQSINLSTHPPIHQHNNNNNCHHPLCHTSSNNGNIRASNAAPTNPYRNPRTYKALLSCSN